MLDMIILIMPIAPYQVESMSGAASSDPRIVDYPAVIQLCRLDLIIFITLRVPYQVANMLGAASCRGNR